SLVVANAGVNCRRGWAANPNMQSNHMDRTVARALRNLADGPAVIALTAIGLAIRLYLVFASYCISADGPEYVRMARDFAAGDRTGALSSIFSPLYPWLMALVHP